MTNTTDPSATVHEDALTLRLVWLTQQTLRGSASAHWFLPLDSINYARIGLALVVELKKLDLSAVAYELPHPTFFNYLAVDLAELKAICEELATLFGLALPVRNAESFVLAHRK